MLRKIISNQKAFSLVELLVVIAIIGMLSAVAVPAYREYILRAKVVEALSVLQKYKQDALASYVENGRYYTSSATDVTHCSGDKCPGDLDLVMSGIRNGGQSAYFRAQFNSDAGFGDTNRNVIIAVIDNDGIINAYCGQWNSDIYIEEKYLPGGCKDTDVSTKVQ